MNTKSKIKFFYTFDMNDKSFYKDCLKGKRKANYISSPLKIREIFNKTYSGGLYRKSLLLHKNKEISIDDLDLMFFDKLD